MILHGIQLKPSRRVTKFHLSLKGKPISSPKAHCSFLSKGADGGPTHTLPVTPGAKEVDAENIETLGNPKDILTAGYKKTALEIC